jgi:GNAT superfamily N-acetyltransferase
VLVAEQGGRVTGFASVGRALEDERIGELYAIYALPEVWGQGAGPALMDAALAHLRESGFESAILWVLDDNPRARAFYEREGWALTEGAREEAFLDTLVREVRYRVELGANSGAE